MTIWLVILATGIATLLGGFFAVRFRDQLHLILGFSAGAVLGVTLFDLMPESLALASGHFAQLTIFAFVSFGFTFYLILDRFFSIHSHGDEHCENPHHQRGKFGAATLALHSFLDGLGIGLAFKVSPAIGWIVALGVLTHDFSDGINTISLVLRDKGSRKSAIRWLVLDAVTPALGVIVAFLIPVSEGNLSLVLAFFAGLFLYIGASDLIPESHHEHPTAWTTFMTILGMLVIYLAIHLAG